ncbi:hypothetical protein, partial [Salmonella enterica]|uniref:hypothetical protein n=1 Tax=Salmonella enterica TaxID=28901 RepID=UPI0029CA281B
IMVPEVGGDEVSHVRGSIEAMRIFTARLLASGAETLVIISPHAPLEARAFVSYPGPTLAGDFARFRAPDAAVSVPHDEDLLGSIADEAMRDGY